MSGEDRYISPIIDAFLRRRQQDLQVQQESEANAHRQASIDNENKYREALIKESSQRLDEAHRKAVADEALRQQQHENTSLATKDAIQQKIAEAVRNAPEGKGDEAAVNVMRSLGGQGILKGSNPLTVGGQELPGSPTTQLTMPNGGGSFGTGGMPSNKEYAAQQAAAAGLKATAQQEPKTKAQLDLDAQKAQERHQDIIDKSTTGLANSLELQKAKGMDAIQLKDMADKTNLAIANAHNGATLAHAKIMMGEDPSLSPQEAGIRAEGASNLYWGIIDGTTKVKDLNKAQKMQVASFAGSIGSEVPGDDIGQLSSSYSRLGAIYQQAEEAAKQYSADAPSGGRVKAVAGGSMLGNLTGIGKDIQGVTDKLNSQAAQLAAVNDPKARLIASVLATQTKGIFDPSRTTAQNLKNIEDIKASNASTFNGATSGLPDDVRTALKARNGSLGWEPQPGTTTPSTISNTPINRVPPGGSPLPQSQPKNSAGHTLWPNASKARGTPTYGSIPEPANWQQLMPPPPTQSPTAVQPQPGIPNQGPQ